MSLQDDYNQMVQQVAKMVNPYKAENYYPILTTALELHSGIVISGTFETDDDTTNGRMSYVTVLRDSTSVDPANGYGFAWTKGDGSDYNVYLVDNNSLANDLFISPNFVVNPQGENAWKAATKIPITISTEYDFELAISTDYAMSLKVWEKGTSDQVTPLTCGAPKNGPNASGTLFGIGVLGTENCQWWYNNLLITTATGVHTAVLFKYKARTADIPDGTSTRIKHYGYGSDVGGNWGLTAFVSKKISGDWVWEEIGTNTAKDVTDKNLSLIQYDFTMGSNYRDTDQFINMLTTSTYAADTVTAVGSYYTDLETALPSGVHVGGCADIYINDPSRILVATNSVNNTTGIIELSAANGFLGPLHSIISVQTSLVGDNLAVNTDWTLVSADPTAAFSIYEYPYISFSPALLNFKINIVYRYYHDGPDVQTLLDSDAYRYSGTDNLAKIMPPTIVTINTLDYRGNVPVETMQSTLKNYINTSTTIVLADIINLVYSTGATWIDIANIDISITAYDYNRIISDPVALTDSYTVGDLSAFFADDTTVANVGRV